jgi:hypothetical protein
METTTWCGSKCARTNGDYCENNGAIDQAMEPRSYQKNKHILQKYHLI